MTGRYNQKLFFRPDSIDEVLNHPYVSSFHLPDSAFTIGLQTRSGTRQSIGIGGLRDINKKRWLIFPYRMQSLPKVFRIVFTVLRHIRLIRISDTPHIAALGAIGFTAALQIADGRKRAAGVITEHSLIPLAASQQHRCAIVSPWNDDGRPPRLKSDRCIAAPT